MNIFPILLLLLIILCVLLAINIILISNSINFYKHIDGGCNINSGGCNINGGGWFDWLYPTENNSTENNSTQNNTEYELELASVNELSTEIDSISTVDHIETILSKITPRDREYLNPNHEIGDTIVKDNTQIDTTTSYSDNTELIRLKRLLLKSMVFDYKDYEKTDPEYNSMTCLSNIDRKKSVLSKIKKKEAEIYDCKLTNTKNLQKKIIDFIKQIIKKCNKDSIEDKKKHINAFELCDELLMTDINTQAIVDKNYTNYKFVIVMPTCIGTIRTNAFCNNSGLSSVYIYGPNTVAEPKAFVNCRLLEDVYRVNSANITKAAFDGCWSCQLRYIIR